MGYSNSYPGKAKPPNWRVVLISIGLVVQIALLLSYVVDWGRLIWDLRDLQSVEKTAFLSWDQEFSNYIQFVRDAVPLESRIVLPPNDSGAPADNIGFMQHFLFPRDVVNCGQNEIRECILRVSGKQTYIIQYQDFPPRELAELSKDYVPFSDKWGLYVPEP